MAQDDTYDTMRKYKDYAVSIGALDIFWCHREIAALNTLIRRISIIGGIAIVVCSCVSCLLGYMLGRIG